MIRALFAAMLAIVMHAVPTAAYSQEYPTRPIRLIVPAAAGSNTDAIARLFAESLERAAKQRIVVENRPGAGGDIGASEAIRAAPDGYTLFFGNTSSLVGNRWLYPRSFDTDVDLVPVLHVGGAAMLVLGGPQLKGMTLGDVISQAKAAPKPWAVASGSTFTAVGYGMFQEATGLDLLLVPYKANQAGFTDLIRGDVQLMVDAIPSSMALVRDGRMVPLALGAPQRSELFPQVPTLRELGFDIVLYGWNAVLVPNGTPPHVVQTLNRLGNQALQDPTVRQKLIALGVDLGGGTPDRLAAMIKEDAAKWGRMISKFKLK